jgi:hypothetical protein
MSENQTSRNQKAGSASTKDAGQAEVQQVFDEANEKGYFGVTTDPTPDENYTLKGVAAGKPTPETDPAQAAKVRDFQAKLSRGEEV